MNSVSCSDIFDVYVCARNFGMSEEEIAKRLGIGIAFLRAQYCYGKNKRVAETAKALGFATLEEFMNGVMIIA